MFIIEDLGKMEKPSTQKMVKFLKTVKADKTKVLLLSDNGLEFAIISLRNLDKAKAIRLENINILDLMTYPNLMIAKDSIEKLTLQVK